MLKFYDVTVHLKFGKGQLKCDGTRAENTFRLSAKRRVHLNQQVASVQSTTCSWGVRISGSDAGYTMFRGSVKGTGYPLLSHAPPSLPLPCVTVCHHISSGLYYISANTPGQLYLIDLALWQLKKQNIPLVILYWRSLFLTVCLSSLLLLCCTCEIILATGCSFPSCWKKYFLLYSS